MQYSFQIKMPTVPELVDLWRHRTAKPPATLGRPFTPRELGQMKLIRDSLEDASFAVLNWTIKNWWQFGEKARYEAGLSSAPENPHIGFFLKHRHVALNLMKNVEPDLVASAGARWKKKAEERYGIEW